ncbi:MAG: HAD family hydrolase [Gloeotrichia echinulata IR180]|jgi:phosphoserine phosphatase
MNFQTMNRKTLVFFLSVMLSIFCLGSSFGCLPANALGDEPLPSWNEGSNKTEIMAFVNKVTNSESDHYVRPEDRIAVFDNDGTLWAEKPKYFQELFLKEQPNTKSKFKLSQLPKTIQEEIDTNGDGKIDSPEIKSVLNEIAVFEGITTDEYIQKAHDFVYQQKHPEFDAEYIKLTYKPVIELVNYLKANGFKVYICSGGGVDFVRSFAEDAYGIPSQEVIGSAIKTKFDREIGGNLIRQPMLAQYNDKQGKPVGIERHIGKRPIIAVGNSSGDLQMFKYTDVGAEKSLIVLINHDDCKREYKYNDTEGKHMERGRLGKPEELVYDNESLVEANKHDNWKVVSMKNDFNTIFESDPQRPIPTCPQE